MPWMLRSYDLSPPGGYPYVQTEGINHSFPSVPYPEFQAQNVASFRQANGLARSTVAEALLDIGEFTCKRLGYMTSFCVDTDNPTIAVNTSVMVNRGCKGCGVPVT